MAVQQERERDGRQRKVVENAFFPWLQKSATRIPEIVRLRDKKRIFPPTDTLTRYLAATGTEKAKARSAIREVFRLLDVRSSAEIPAIIGDEERKNELKARANQRFARLYQTPDIETAISNHGDTADGIIAGVTKDILQQPVLGSQFEMASEVQGVHHPVELALMIFDEKFSQRVRFEAKRKLLLMKLVASTDHRARRTEMEEAKQKFDEFLDNNVWVADEGIGTFDTGYLLSTHDPESNKCIKVIVISEDEAQSPDLVLESSQMLTRISRRRFEYMGKPILAYKRPRVKERANEVLKMLIRGKENPEVAVQDTIGLMVVLDTVQDVRKFQKSLEDGAEKAESGIEIQGEEDTLKDGMRKDDTRPGSSREYKDHNFYVVVDGIRMEVILHTNESYLDSNYEKGSAHTVYAVKRTFDSGVIGLLFDPEIYEYDEANLRRTALNRVRRKLSFDITFGSVIPSSSE